MADTRLLAHWRNVELQLQQAAAYLADLEHINLEGAALEEFQKFLNVNELEIAMWELEAIAKQHNVESGFWRKLMIPALSMKLHDKAEEFQRRINELT